MSLSEMIIHLCTCALNPKLVRHISVSLDARFQIPHFDNGGICFLSWVK